MNGVHLLRTLKELGAPINDETSPESVDWMFSDDAAVPFLEWFCTNTDPNYNCLTTDEIQKFKLLEESGQVLEGEELAHAHANLVGHDDDVTEADLEEEIASLKAEYEKREERIGKLIQMTNTLNLQQTSLAHKASLESSSEGKATEGLKQQMKELTQQDETLDKEVKKLADMAEQLVAVYGSKYDEEIKDNDTEKEKNGLFLSQQNMDLHKYSHEKLMISMNAFAHKQFFNGIAQIPCASSKDDYQLVDIGQQESKAKEKIKSDQANELARLWKVYVQCELERVQIMLKEETLSAELSFAQDKLKSYQIPGHCSDMPSLHKELRDNQRQANRYSSEITTLLENRIRDLISRCANSQSVQILQGEYDLKIARQDYFIQSQEQVIGHLIKQQALYEFLALCFAGEILDHQKNHQLLTAVTMELKRNLEQYKKRLDMMSKLEPKTTETKTVVDPNDKMIQSMHAILDPEGHQNSLYVTYKALSESAAKLANSVTAAENCETYLRRDGNEKLDKLEKTLKGYESRLYSESSTMRGIPQLSPQQLIDVMKSLESTVERLESALLDVTKQVKSKRSTLEKSSLLQEERNLFVKFHTDPQKLKTMLDDLSARVEARSIGK